MSAIVTQHAIKRGETRLGLSYASVLRMAEIALEKGIKREQTTGDLKRYLDDLYVSQHKANNSRIYGLQVFLFADEKLITIFHVPKPLKKAVAKIKEAMKA